MGFRLPVFCVSLALGCVLSVPRPAAAETRWRLDVESGAAFIGLNDIAIPGDTGTRFSLTDDFKVKPALFFRLRLSCELGARHRLSALLAPLRFRASGPAPRAIRYNGAEFPVGAAVEGTYRFNSYRLTYFYQFVDAARWKVGAGFTAKVRDAAIRLESGSVKPEKTNVGFVPLIHFRVEYILSPKAGILLEGDALAAPQGRAEDVLLAFLYRIADSLRLKAGYRIVEGGADNSEVYNFALIHYLSAGFIWSF
jgi:hypothetical protein